MSRASWTASRRISGSSEARGEKEEGESHGGGTEVLVRVGSKCVLSLPGVKRESSDGEIESWLHPSHPKKPPCPPYPPCDSSLHLNLRQKMSA